MYIRTTTEDKSGTVTAYMTQTDHDQLMANAKLGALVRKLPAKMSMFRRDNLWCVEGWTGNDIFEGEWINASGDTPEAALLAAGIGED